MRIELYLVDAMEVASFGPVCLALRARGVDARIVAVPDDSHAGDPGWFDHANAVRLLRAADLPFVETPDWESDLAVTTQRPWVLRHYRRRKARTMYAVGFYAMDGFQADRIRGFDAIFAVGEHARRALAQHLDPSRVFVTGYPKYDDFFRRPPDAAAIRTRLGLAPTQPVVAYLPTWRDKSSIDGFAEAVAAIASTPAATTPAVPARLVVKPHHCTVRFERARMERLARLPRSVLAPPDAPLADLVSIADLVVVDARSGALAEVILTRPEQALIVIAPPDDHDTDRLDARLAQLAPIVSRPEALGPVARDLLARRARIDVTVRRTAVDDLFAHRDGSAAHRTAAAMIDLVARTHRVD